MKKLALLLSLLALGALGLVVFEGGDDETTAVSEAETAGDEYQNLRPYYRQEAEARFFPAELSRRQAQELKRLARKQEAEGRFLPAELSRRQVQELKRGRGKEAQELKRAANDWASRFVTNNCNRYMGQPFCERMGPWSKAFQRSFADATVEDIKFKGFEVVPEGILYLATVKFSNGEVVVFSRAAWTTACAGPGSGCVWNIAEPDQNRRFLRAAGRRG